jgi:hypothetical protein
MPSVTIDPELFQRMQAAKQSVLPETLVSEAIRRYLWELDREKISQETAAYHRQHTQIKAAYLGQYIAMLNGQVVDHDTDFASLHQRVRQRFEHTPVMMTLVEDQPDLEFTRRGFREG